MKLFINLLSKLLLLALALCLVGCTDKPVPSVDGTELQSDPTEAVPNNTEAVLAAPESAAFDEAAAVICFSLKEGDDYGVYRSGEVNICPSLFCVSDVGTLYMSDEVNKAIVMIDPLTGEKEIVSWEDSYNIHPVAMGCIGETAYCLSDGDHSPNYAKGLQIISFVMGEPYAIGDLAIGELDYIKGSEKCMPCGKKLIFAFAVSDEADGSGYVYYLVEHGKSVVTKLESSEVCSLLKGESEGVPCYFTKLFEHEFTYCRKPKAPKKALASSCEVIGMADDDLILRFTESGDGYTGDWYGEVESDGDIKLFYDIASSDLSDIYFPDSEPNISISSSGVVYMMVCSKDGWLEVYRID